MVGCGGGGGGGGGGGVLVVGTVYSAPFWTYIVNRKGGCIVVD